MLSAFGNFAFLERRTNLPQTVMHIWQKVIFKHALADILIIAMLSQLILRIEPIVSSF